jgi:diguanylate cyclase (GGDEF)-like protein
VDSSTVLALLNPAISLSLAGAFLAFWFYQQHRPYLHGLAVGYACAGFGFILQLFVLPIGFELTKCISSAFFIMAGWALSSAIVGRYNRQIAPLALAALGLGGFAAFLWFMFVNPSLVARILSINFAICGMALLVTAKLFPIRNRGPIEKALFVLTVLSAANLTIRPLLVLWLGGMQLSYEELYTSLYWTTAVLSHALLSLLTALCLFAAAGMDVMNVLKSHSETDTLSGLLNRRGFDQAARRLLEQRIDLGLPLAVVLADLDHFKSINDRFGHDVGDSIIAEFGASIRAMAPDGAVASRLGGEEFAIVLPLADIAAARLFAEGLRTAFAATAPATASFGIAIHDGEKEMRPLLRRADQALYAAKSAGRNRVVIFTDRQREALPAARLAAV